MRTPVRSDPASVTEPSKSSPLSARPEKRKKHPKQKPCPFRPASPSLTKGWPRAGERRVENAPTARLPPGRPESPQLEVEESWALQTVWKQEHFGRGQQRMGWMGPPSESPGP
ncbi:hypothetical protein E2C01_089472 [Portunus trituberculatus]|uniref:Uncharacterized protein n=1 Tax=Portunus trituberculatus TaxID=210409 RepID=A0A5B7JMH0_PORTR|nr:hypothetical protein [Portunus trituberculatus]